jgi:hypothetical protein
MLGPLLRRAVAVAVAASALLAAPSVAGAAVSPNLIVNGDAEAGLCSSSGFEDMTSPGWTISSGAPEEICFTNTGGFPHAHTPGAQPGQAFLAGGTHGDSALTQTLSVATDQGPIDAGRAIYDLSGWLGGQAAQKDGAALVATFLGAGGGSLGSTQIGPVTSADRGSVTEFLKRETTGSVPPGTRTISLDLEFTWAAGQTTDGYADGLSLTVNSAQLKPRPLTPPPSTVPRLDHVFLVFMENENFSATSNTVDHGMGIIGNPQAPYINQLASQNSLLVNYSALTHYSDPNYYGLAAGTTFGHTGGHGGLQSNCINSCVFDAPSLADRIDAAGKTWKEYEESAHGNCDTHAHGFFYPDDAPFLYFASMRDNPAYCQAHMQPLTAMFSDLQSASTTPNFSWFAADDCDDMESCGIHAGDKWLAATVPQILASPAWRNQRSLLIVTWDEDGNGGTGFFGNGQTNQVATILVGSQSLVRHGFQSAVRYDHYSTARTIEQALGLAPLTDNDRFATPINDVFTH